VGRPGESDDVFTDLQEYLAFLGIEPPAWALTAVVALLAVGVLIAAVKSVLPLAHEAWRVVGWVLGRRLGDERRRRRKRQLFAQHLDDQLRHLELQEDWRDEKYAELEAEVEIERSWRRRWLRRLLPLRKTTLRRVRSLSRALTRSDERLVLLEGEPGAGKSIALRHLARTLARRATTSRDIRAVIPLYLNLKLLDARPDEVTSETIRAFVLATLTEANSRDVQEVLDSEFDRGLEEGGWLFLFDSFDEIPDVLSATAAHQVAPLYAHAIANFLGPFSRCRGIVASRDFSSPDIEQFTRFRILRLSHRQQQRLITCADLDRRVDRALRAGLATASQDIATFAGNPMFLGLLCAHMRNNAAFPTGSHRVFEDYLAHRLSRDGARIQARFGIGVEFMRAGAEEIAFLMASVPRLGLTPSRTALLGAAPAQERVTPRLVDTVLDALEYTKLGRAETNSTGQPTFSFVHRRFQEYFATCVVIRQPDRVPVDVLLDNDQWRETAVTLLQVQDHQSIGALLAEATRRVRQHATDVAATRFRWPAGCLHLLGILATGLETHPSALTDELRTLVDGVLRRAWDGGHRLDKRRALAFANLASVSVAERLLTEAFRSRNEYLREAAFRTAGALPALGAPLREQIRDALLGLAAGTDLYRKRGSTVAQIKRLAQPAEFLRLLNLLTVAIPVTLVFSVGGLLYGVIDFQAGYTLVTGFEAVIFATILMGLLAAAGMAIVSGTFATAAMNRQRGNLDKALSRAAQPEYRLLSAAAIAVLIATNAVLCAAAISSVANLLAWQSGVALAILVYGVLWPAAVIWVSKVGIGTAPIWWLFLPVLLVTIGGYRLPNWFRTRLRQLREWGDGAMKVARMLRSYVPRLGKAAIAMVASAAVITLAVTALSIYQGLAVNVLRLMLSVVAPSLALLWFLTSGITLRKAASTVQSADDALTVIAQTRSTRAIGLVVEWFGAQRISRHPEVRAALENLVGEVEQAQLRADTSPDLALNDACPSLANQGVPNHPLLDLRPLRWFTVLQVRQLREETLDDVARLAEQDSSG
jgi:hypothetical protein